MITDALAALARLPFPLVLLVAGGASAVESGLGVGMVFPGETGVLILGTTATGVPRFVLMFLVVGLAASVGDHVGYWLGRRYGARLRGTRVVGRLGVRHYDRAMDALHRHGAAAVVLTRLVPVVRTLSPPAAGASGLPYRRFLPASVAAGLLWSGVYVGAGAFAGASARYLDSVLGRASWILLFVLVLVATTVWLWRRRRATQRSAQRRLVRPEADTGAEPVAGAGIAESAPNP